MVWFNPHPGPNWVAQGVEGGDSVENLLLGGCTIEKEVFQVASVADLKIQSPAWVGPEFKTDSALFSYVTSDELLDLSKARRQADSTRSVNVTVHRFCWGDCNYPSLLRRLGQSPLASSLNPSEATLCSEGGKGRSH